MQTFLPYPDFRKSLACLDFKRCGKQGVEAKQIYDTVIGIRIGRTDIGWRHHPAVLMWLENLDALALYYNTAREIWKSYGYQSTMPTLGYRTPVEMPWWFGNERFHAAHRSNLLRKNFGYYSIFGWTEPPDLPYVWPIQCRKGILTRNIKPQQEMNR